MSKNSQKSRNYSFNELKKELLIMKESERHAVQDIKAKILPLLELEKTHLKAQQQISQQMNKKSHEYMDNEENTLKFKLYHANNNCSDLAETKMEPFSYELQMPNNNKSNEANDNRNDSNNSNDRKLMVHAVREIQNADSLLPTSHDSSNNDDTHDKMNTTHQRLVSSTETKANTSLTAVASTTTTVVEVPKIEKRKSKFFNQDKQVVPSATSSSHDISEKAKISGSPDKRKPCIIS